MLADTAAAGVLVPLVAESEPPSPRPAAASISAPCAHAPEAVGTSCAAAGDGVPPVSGPTVVVGRPSRATTTAPSPVPAPPTANVASAATTANVNNRLLAR